MTTRKKLMSKQRDAAAMPQEQLDAVVGGMYEG